MTERLAYRRTWTLVYAWEPPEGVTVAVVCWPQDPRIDVLLSLGGEEDKVVNVAFRTREECDSILGYLARQMLARAVAAYAAHEVAGAAEARLEMSLEVAGRAFRRGLEEALCRGTGRAE